MVKGNLSLLRAKLPWVFGIADQIVFSAGNFLSGLIIARTCSQAEFGLFSLGMTVVYILINARCFNICTADDLWCPSLW